MAELKGALYGLYLSAFPITLDRIRARIGELAEGEEVSDPTATEMSVETIRSILSDPVVPADVRKVTAVAAALLHAHPVPEVVPVVRGHPEIERMRRLWETAAIHRPPGRVITEVGAGELEVHRALPAAGENPDALPHYIARPHDRELDDLVEAALGVPARSGIVVLVSDSSSGKTRALFEALHRPVPRTGRPGGISGRRDTERSLAKTGWRVWPPLTPQLPRRFLDELAQVEPGTVVWLNEAQRYLIEPDRDTAQAIAAGLRTLLTDPAQTPVLVLGTLWPSYLDQIMRRPAAGQADLFADARALLTGHTIRVPEAFTSQELDAARASEDPRLRNAAQAADIDTITLSTRSGAAGRQRVPVTQFLAGVPGLLDYYATASTTALAVLSAAMDARRLGHSEWLPLDLLHHAAPDYLDPYEQQRHLADQDWFTTALDELTAPRIAAARALHRPPVTPGQPIVDHVRLEDYLDQHGRRTRDDLCPPQGFWDAVHQHAATAEDHARLAKTAHVRHRLHIADMLWRRAADRDRTTALILAADARERAGDRAGAERHFRHAAAAGDAYALTRLARIREQAGDHAGAEVLLRRAVDAGHPPARVELAQMRVQAGDRAEAEQLLRAGADSGHYWAMSELGAMLIQAGDRAEAEQLLRTVADTGNGWAMMELADMCIQAGDRTEAERLLHRAADADHPMALPRLVEMRLEAGDRAGAEELLRQAADTGTPYALTHLARLRGQIGGRAEAEAVYLRAADSGDVHALVLLAGTREQTGDRAEAELLLRRAADAGHPGAPSLLAEMRVQAGDRAGAEELLLQAGDKGYYQALIQLAEMREQDGDRIAAMELLRRVADSGNAYGVIDFAERNSGHETWDRLVRFGLEPDGSVSAPW
ncbi:SEL1-like repeat protein [Saccharothrix ecbatanensis]|nr:tetratricopeptide repeat protein [Saccharothrix ecbatanensis]